MHLGVPPPRTNLSILERLVSTYQLWIDTFDHLPKRTRYTLGTKIDALFIECITLIFTASHTPKERKLAAVQQVSTHFDLLKFMLQVGWRTGVLEQKQYIALSTPLDEIGRMIGGWYQRCLKETQPLAKR